MTIRWNTILSKLNEINANFERTKLSVTNCECERLSWILKFAETKMLGTMIVHEYEMYESALLYLVIVDSLNHLASSSFIILN